MERARYNTELCYNPDPLLNNVKPSNFWGSHQLFPEGFFYSHSGNNTSNIASFLRHQSRESVPLRPSQTCFPLFVIPELVFLFSSFPSLPRESVSTWHGQPLSERIQRHITRSRWQCLHFHLARSRDCRASHSNDEECSDCRLRTAMTFRYRHSRTCFPLFVIPELASGIYFPPGTVNPCQSAF